MNTRQWLETIPDPTTREKALGHMEAIVADLEADSFAEALQGAFEWRHTPEGHEFWSNLIPDYDEG